MHADGDVAWEITTTDGSTVVVAMSWIPDEDKAGPPAQGVDCSLSVKPGLEPALRDAVRFIAIGGRPLIGPREENGDLTWHDADGTIRLVLTRYESVGEFAARDRSNDANAQWYKSRLRDHRAHPWELSLR